jgi:putative endonuclease
MKNSAQLFGASSEVLAAKHLKKNGYKIIITNYRNRYGEIDIIAKEKGVLIFIEVKARQSHYYGSPKGAVTRAKQKKISQVALHYLKETDQMMQKARFDVVSISFYSKEPQIEVIKNAFELAYGG